MSGSPASPAASTPHVAVIGAGMVGLSTAWFLQEHGAEVTVLDRQGVAAGASWGNAGWLTPALTVPLPEPAVLGYGLRALIDRGSPLYLPLRASPQLWRFLLRFARNSTNRRWQRAMHDLVPLVRQALPAFETLAQAGVAQPAQLAEPFLAGFVDHDHLAALLDELRRVEAAGLPSRYEVLAGRALRRAEPLLGERVEAAVHLHDQRYLDPPRFMDALASAVVRRGATLDEATTVTRLSDAGRQVVVHTDTGERAFDQVVVATGGWLHRLARPFGLRHPLQAGRGYSFSVKPGTMLRGPVYFPVQRIACTPLGDRLRIAGTMEFRPADAPLDPRRVQAMVASARHLLRDVDLDLREDEWVGARPVTADGLPLIGPTRSPRIHVAGGHGMWGIVLGPATGRLLAESVVTGHTAPELAPFDPRRR